MPRRRLIRALIVREVRNVPLMSTPPTSLDPDALAGRVEALPGVPELRAAAGDVPAHLVGGAVRDLLARRPFDLDVAVEGDPAADRATGWAARFTPTSASARCARSWTDGPVDLARTRTETYPSPARCPW